MSRATTTHPAPAGAVPAAISGAPPPSALRGHQQHPTALGYEGFHTRLAEPRSWPHHTQLFKFLVTATGRRIHLPTAQTPPQPQEPGLLLLLAASSAQTTSNHVERLYSNRHDSHPLPPPRAFSSGTSACPANTHLKKQKRASAAVCSWSLESQLITCIFNLPGTHAEILAK